MPFKCVVPGCRSNYYHKKGTPSIPMMRYPGDPEKIKIWNNAICRTDFCPSPYSHVCIKHFRDDQLVPVVHRVRPDIPLPQCLQSARPWSRRLKKLREDAVPCVFEVDPSKHKVRACWKFHRPTPRKIPLEQEKRECEILTGMKVEFKPEMWEEKENAGKEKTEEATGEPPIKRGRGRPRKQVISVKTDSNITVKSEPVAVVSCCALACTNTSENFSMHTLPRNPALRKLWVEKIDRLDWLPDDALCEIHFEEDMWDRDLGSERALRPDAVPSLFLHGEAIKSWVTMDNTGNIADIVVDGRSTNDEDSINGESNHGNAEESMDGTEMDEDEGPSIFIKREALEPEIDMVEGSEEDMVTRETSAGEQFETVFCDSTFNDHEESEDGHFDDHEDEDMPLIIPSVEEENPLEERSSPILQDGEVSCLEDSTKTTGASGDGKYLVISRANKVESIKDKIIRRRSSNQLTDEFQCPICDRRLSRRKNLEIHIEKLHPHGEMSEYQKRRKDGWRPDDLKTMATYSNSRFKKPPPPLKPIVPQCLLSPSIPIIPLNTPATSSGAEGVITSSFPIISFSAQSPLVSSSIQTTPSTVVTPTLVASQTMIPSQPIVAPTALIASPSLVASSSAGNLISTSSIVTTPRPLDPSPAGGEMRKQFLLLLPKQTVIPNPPPLKKSSPPPAPEKKEKPASAYDEVSMFSVNLSVIPLDRRLRLKEKLKELVDAVVTKQLNPDKIIIAYDRT